MLKELANYRKAKKDLSAGQVKATLKQVEKELINPSFDRTKAIQPEEKEKIIKQSKAKNENAKAKEQSFNNERTIDTTLPLKSKGNICTSPGSSNIFLKRSQSSKVGKMSSSKEINKSFQFNRPLSKDLKFEKIEMNQSFEGNLKTLEKLIEGIKINGFDRYRNELEAKIKIKSEIEASVDSLNKKFRLYNSQKKLFGMKNGKLMCEIGQMSNLNSRIQRDEYFLIKNNPKIRQEIEDMKEAIEENKKQTKTTIALNLEEERKIASLKEEIQKTNIGIAEKEKEMDNLRHGITLLAKHIEVLKKRVHDEEHRSREFLLNVSTLANQTLK